MGRLSESDAHLIESMHTLTLYYLGQTYANKVSEGRERND